MAAWTNIPDSDLDPESPITTSLMIALRDNPIAIAEGASGHPEIVQAALKTTTGEVSTTTVAALLTLPGGQFGFYPQTKGSTGAGSLRWMAAIGSPINNTGVNSDTVMPTSYVTHIQLGSQTGSQTMFAQQRFIQASPPYDLGNGEISLFIFIVMDSNGKIESLYIAPDPPWANNGPTNIGPDFFRNGIGYQYRKTRPIIPKAPEKMAAWLDTVRNAPCEQIEITQEFKQSDMPLIPHPFLGNDLTDKTIVLLEPTGDICEQLFTLHENGGGVSDLIHDGHLIIGNTPLDINAPPGVVPVALKWRSK